MPAVILNYDARSVKANNLLKFLMSLDFVKITSEDEYFLSEVKEASKEAKKIATGKTKGIPVSELLKTSRK